MFTGPIGHSLIDFYRAWFLQSVKTFEPRLGSAGGGHIHRAQMMSKHFTGFTFSFKFQFIWISLWNLNHASLFWLKPSYGVVGFSFKSSHPGGSTTRLHLIKIWTWPIFRRLLSMVHSLNWPPTTNKTDMEVTFFCFDLVISNWIE